MFGRLILKISYTWKLMFASFGILAKDKELILFPLLSGLSCILVITSFVTPIAVSAVSSPEQTNALLENEALGYLYLFLFYFANYFVITFFNVAVVSGAVERMTGGDPTFESCLRSATGLLPQILGWAAVCATVGTILKIIESRSERIGQIIVSVLGSAWTITTFFVVPVLVVERANPIRAFQSSAALLKKTWGEQLIGNTSFGFMGALIGLPGFLLPITGAVLGGTNGFLIGLGAMVLFWVALSLVMSTAASIFQTALYAYASEGAVVEPFDENALKGAIN